MFLYRVKLFTLAGFAVWVDASWLILAALITWTLASGVFPTLVPNLPVALYWWMAIAGTIGLFLSIVLHELSHSLVARRFSMPISDITLFIFGGVAELHSEPTNARGEFLMAVVGPVTSLILGALLLATAAIGAEAPTPLWGVLTYLGTINLILGLFNLVPAFPLDGGRMLRALLWRWKHDLRWATTVAAGGGSLFGIVLIGLGVWEVLGGNLIGGVWLFFIGLFLNGAAGAAKQQMLVRDALAGCSVASLMKREPVSVTTDLSIADLIENYIFRYNFNFFPVLRDGQLVGCISAREVRGADRRRWSELKVGDIMDTCLPDKTVTPAMPAFDALTKMQRARSSRLLVVENGKLRGILSLTDMLQFLSPRLEIGNAILPSQSERPRPGASR